MALRVTAEHIARAANGEACPIGHALEDRDGDIVWRVSEGDVVAMRPDSDAEVVWWLDRIGRNFIKNFDLRRSVSPVEITLRRVHEQV